VLLATFVKLRGDQEASPELVIVLWLPEHAKILLVVLAVAQIIARAVREHLTIHVNPRLIHLPFSPVVEPVLVHDVHSARVVHVISRQFGRDRDACRRERHIRSWHVFFCFF
jgi:hypothetical protein